MIKSIEKIDKRGWSRERWLQERRKGIGGSEAAAVVGLNPYASPFSVWADKLGKLEEKETTEAMRQGTDLEDYVARRFSEQTGKKIRQSGFMYRNPAYPWALANVDRLIVGEDAGLECKTTSQLNLRKFKGGEFPASYYVQCMHYLAVTGCQRWYLAALIYSTEFKVFTIERDEDEIKALMDAEHDLWKHVQNRTPPETDGSKATTDALSQIYTGTYEDSPVDLTPVKINLARLAALKAEAKRLEEGIAAEENAVKRYMGDSVYGKTADGWSVSWKNQTRRTFDHKSFLLAHPSTDAENYYKTSNSRQFRVNYKEEK
jgi:putative phage-type endonuclease